MENAHLQWPFFEERHRRLAEQLSAWAGATIQDVWERSDDVDGTCRVLVRQLADAGWLSLVARLENRLGDQAALASEIVTLTSTVKDPVVITSTLWTAAAIAGERNQMTLSARLFGAEEALRDSIEFVLDPVYAASYRETVARIRDQLGEARFTSIWEAGRAVPPTTTDRAARNPTSSACSTSKASCASGAKRRR